MKKIYLVIGVFLFTSSLFSQKIENKEFTNLHKVDNNLYRSEQPSKVGMIELQNLGIRTILDIRRFHGDKTKQTTLILEDYPMKTGNITYNDIVKALRIIRDSNKPVLIHCLHGSDRTGCIVAVYRMVYDGWTKEESIKEFLNPVFGYHKTMYPNILSTLEFLDVKLLKKDLER
jgi:tyrosine-protein phosphatase SIW14